MIGATPDCLISLLSPCYGGSASDRQSVERSNLNDIVERGNSVMGDKGFNVQDLFASIDIKVITATFLKSNDTRQQFIKDKDIV